MLIEMIKSDRGAIETLLTGLRYRQFAYVIDTLAIHKSDPILQHIQQTDGGLAIS